MAWREWAVARRSSMLARCRARSSVANAALGGLILTVIAACSGGDSPSFSGATASTAQRIVVNTTPATTAVAQVPIIMVTSVINGESVSDAIELTQATTTDPFGRFGTCSGISQRFGAYNLLVSHTKPDVGSVQVSTSRSVRRPSAVGATARIERDEEVFVANGVLDFGEDYSIGTFAGETETGDEVTVDFNCSAGRVGRPIDRTRQFVDLAALFTRGGQTRIVSGGFEQPCLLGRVEVAAGDGDQIGTGAISAATVKPNEVMLRLGGREYRFENSTVTSSDANAGTFRGVTDDGLEVTGAFDCRR